MVATNAMIRLDVFSFIYMIALLPIIMASRSKVRRYLWSMYLIFVTGCTIAQYLCALGLPPRACKAYPWSFANRSGVHGRILEWIFVPDYQYPPNAKKLIVDYFLLLFAYQQSMAFTNEMKSGYREIGGCNDEITFSDRSIRRSNPTKDFTSTYQFRSKLDVLKNIVFQHGFTFVTGLLYATATTRVSFFCLIYLVLSFAFFWYGSDLLIRPSSSLIRIWSIPVYYCYTVIVVKAIFQLIACVGHDQITCWVAQLFSLVCLKPGIMNFDSFGDPKCTRADVFSHFMDVFCLFFLMIQKRIFGSFYFQHVVVELKTAARLASRGAIILNRLVEEEVQHSVERENAEIEKLRQNIERIQGQQAKLSHIYRQANEHFEAIRSGDYYMFDFLDDDVRSDGSRRRISSSKEHLPPEVHSSAIARSSSDPSFIGHIQTRSFPDDLSPIKPPEVHKGEEKSTTSPDTAQQASVDMPNRTITNFKRVIGFVYRQLNHLKEWLTPHMNTAIDLTINWLDSRSNYLSQIDKELKQVKRIIKARLISNDREWVDFTIQQRGFDVTDYNSIENLDEIGDVPDGLLVDDSPERINFAESALLHQTTSQANIEARQSGGSIDFSRTTALSKSLYFYVVANSDMLCYFFMILNHLLSASVLSMILPLSVFLWAMLCVPRPPRLYWLFVISYTMCLIVVKYMYQFRLNLLVTGHDLLDSSSIFYPFKILGVESFAGSTFDVTDLFLLIALFFHKSMQKRMGLWKSSTDEDIFYGDVPDGPSTFRRLSTIHRMSTTLRSRLSNWTTKHSLLAGFHSDSIVPVRDLYTPMVMCDFLAVFILIVSYSSFGQVVEGSDVVQSLLENKVPIAFLILLLVQFIFIVIDRALYLRKNVQGKTIFQIIQVIAIHIWLFFVLPKLTQRHFVNNPAAQIWYLLKCMYFGFSAAQIKCRYPTRILGSVFTKSYDYFHLFGFKIMLLIPFVYEIRTLMDWVFTDTCLSLMSWLQFEDIFSSVYQLKCWRVAEKNKPTPRGQSMRRVWKYCTGGALVLFIFCIIWFPLLLFSLSSSLFESNPPSSLSTELRFGSYPPLFSVSAMDSDIKKCNSDDIYNLKQMFQDSPAAGTFIRGFGVNDIVKLYIRVDSADIWHPTPPSLERLLADLNKRNVPLRLLLNMRRKPDEIIGSSQSPSVNAERSVMLNPETYSDFIQLMNDSSSNGSVHVSCFYPRYIHAKARSDPIEVEAFKAGNASNCNYYGSVNFTSRGRDSLRYWQMMIGDYVTENNTSFVGGKASDYDKQIKIIIFNDRISPQSISFLTKYGILGIYTTFVLLVARLIRSVCQVSTTIMFRELPNVDPLLQLCSDIRLVREKRLFRYEEQLFSQLIFLYRSPESLFKFTRLKME